MCEYCDNDKSIKSSNWDGYGSISIDKNGNLYEFEIGDEYTVWLTLDPSFDISDYNFTCKEGNLTVISNESIKINLKMTEQLVGERKVVSCTLRSSKNWHRYNGYDQQFALVFRVLPPN